MMTTTPMAFLDAEIAYRQQRVAEQYQAAQRRHWVPRRRSLRLPHHRPRPVAVA